MEVDKNKRASFFFSFIIPVYNVAKYIDECLDSILTQSFTDFEVILVNDGSTDESGEICEKYAKEYECIKVIHKHNSGTASARNTGLQIVQGQYLWFIDADDFIVKDSLKILKELLAKGEDIEVCNFSNIEFIDGKFNEQLINKFKVKDDQIIIEENNSVRFPSSVCYSVFKREFLLKSKILFNESNYFEDEWFNLNLYSNNRFKILNCNTPLYVYRKYRSNSKTNAREPDKIFDKCVSVIDLCEYIKTIPLNLVNENALQLKKRMYIEIGLGLLISYIQMESSPNKNELLNFFRKKIPKIPVKGNYMKSTQIPRLLYNFNINIFLIYIKYFKG